jgi:gamma-glutamyltranspeptidase/glutathione hydrolase
MARTLRVATVGAGYFSQFQYEAWTRMDDAVAAPRFCATSDTIDVVNRIPRFVTDQLAAMGYPVRRSYRSYHFAGAHAIRIEGGKWYGAADPGSDGIALQV